ncbi:MAG: molybdenum cofactor guanylyltransferase [Pyrinomonadaceae bacterium]
MNNIDAYILAGGKSSRMGQPKVNVEFRGVRMLGLVASAIRAALPESCICVVIANEDQLAEAGAITGFGDMIYDLGEDRGPVGGLHAAVEHSRSEWTFVAACDLPMLSPDLISFLVSQIDDNADVVLPIQPDGVPQPLAALYRVERVRDHLLELENVKGNSPSLMAAIDTLQIKRVEFTDYRHIAGSNDLFINVNSPRDLENAASLLEAGARVVAE